MLLLLVARESVAQNTVPAARPLEALVKGSLMSFNDANLTGDYRVFHARLSEPFRKQYTPARLKETFKEFNEKNVDIDIITALTPSYDPAPFVDKEGKLIVKGYFPTDPTRVAFEMDFIPSDGDWKLIRINVRLAPAS
ncbi:MAG: hypothetical protein ACHQK9_08125 [Reyranellales bacterium]